jgi:hypothetical protein
MAYTWHPDLALSKCSHVTDDLNVSRSSPIRTGIEELSLQQMPLLHVVHEQVPFACAFPSRSNLFEREQKDITPVVRLNSCDHSLISLAARVRAPIDRTVYLPSACAPLSQSLVEPAL